MGFSMWDFRCCISMLRESARNYYNRRSQGLLQGLSCPILTRMGPTEPVLTTVFGLVVDYYLFFEGVAFKT